jgi:hypothetical protein
MTTGLQQSVKQYLRDHGRSTAETIATNLQVEWKDVYGALVWLAVRGEVRRDDVYKTGCRWEAM